MRYVISDLHFGHGNIIKHCNRPFESVEEMNNTLLRNWNSTVDPGDTVFCLGDLALWGPEAAVEWAPKLNGNIVLVRGNHDDINPEELPLTVVDSCVFTHGKYNFGCVHWPEKTDNPGGDWLVYGHHHNNDLDTYPFINSDKNRINVSVEVIGYEPLSVEKLTNILDTTDHARTIEDI